MSVCVIICVNDCSQKNVLWWYGKTVHPKSHLTNLTMIVPKIGKTLGWFPNCHTLEVSSFAMLKHHKFPGWCFNIASFFLVCAPNEISDMQSKISFIMTIMNPTNFDHHITPFQAATPLSLFLLSNIFYSIAIVLTPSHIRYHGHPFSFAIFWLIFDCHFYNIDHSPLLFYHAHPIHVPDHRCHEISNSTWSSTAFDCHPWPVLSIICTPWGVWPSTMTLQHHSGSGLPQYPRKSTPNLHNRHNSMRVDPYAHP